jgi:hypothetical protein
LTARLDRLGPAKEIAQIGAVIGREFSDPLLAAAAPESANSLQASLAQLVASGVIFVSGEAPDAPYAFKHALVRDAAYATRHGANGSDSIHVSPMLSRTAFPSRSKLNPSCWRTISPRRGLPSEPLTTCEGLGSARSSAQLMLRLLGI